MSEIAPITLQTERLTLRFLHASDAQALYTIHSDPLVMRYFSGTAWTDPAQGDAEIALALDGYNNGSCMKMALVLRETGKLIGTINPHAFHAQNRRCEIGYALASAFWGQGYLSEAMRVTLDYLFKEMNMNRIEADIDPRNLASAKLLERMGFQKEGTMPERWIVNGEICDTAFYGLLRRGWEGI
ncbi:GNAT family N-acetyltransferase [Massilia sp. CCM 8734]|uniref:GNAT family N-acetyltransferase n=1 Tax=Massilia sp. CCM 8734 TaxID=2609283 RepID=UPI001423A30F|nr:GNAT family protein [Massilia sp. CCM 8734]NHZ97756.1 GNAT family N-acetyltransferase [Massilia sp. CCM 8734]